MQDLWNTLSTFEQIFWYIAIPFSVILLIQLVMTFAGLGGGSADIGEGVPAVSDLDVDTDGVFPNDNSDVSGVDVPQFAIFTIRNFIAFFTVFGWSGIAGIRAGLSNPWVIILAVVLGFVAMLMISSLFYFISKLADNGGTLVMGNAIGQVGTVYIPIKANGGNVGQIQVSVQESFREMKAVTHGNEDLPTGTMVKVSGLSSGNVLIVEKFTN